MPKYPIATIKNDGILSSMEKKRFSPQKRIIKATPTNSGFKYERLYGWIPNKKKTSINLIKLPKATETAKQRNSPTFSNSLS